MIFLEVEKYGEKYSQSLKSTIYHRLLSDVFPPSTTVQNLITVSLLENLREQVFLGVFISQDKITFPGNIRLKAVKLWNNFVWPVTAIKKCPMDAVQTLVAASSEHVNYLAIGTHNGHILFYNVLTGFICKEFSIHNNSVR